MLLARKDERLFTGRAVRATILVCRIRNFAHFIEPLTPEQTLRYLNEFYGLAGTAIQRHRGIIETFLGDGIVAVFGVPLDNPTQEDDALRAALDVVRHVVAMRERWAKQHRKPFTVGIGINTGDVIAGDAGFRERREFTVVGSEATMAHRLQEAAFVLNAYIVAARSTCASHLDDYQLVPGQRRAARRRAAAARRVRRARPQPRRREIHRAGRRARRNDDRNAARRTVRRRPAAAPNPAAKPAASASDAELPVARPRPRTRRPRRARPASACRSSSAAGCFRRTRTRARSCPIRRRAARRTKTAARRSTTERARPRSP